MSAMILRPNRVWRLAVTGFCFALFGLDGFLLSTIWFNVPPIAVWDKVQRRRIVRHSIVTNFRLFLTVTKRLDVLDYQIEGRGALCNEQGCPVATNHPTLIDYVLPTLVMSETDYPMKSALLKNPFLGGVVRVADYSISSQADALLPACQRRLEQSDTVLTLPEGIRARPEGAMTLQRGAASIAVHCSSGLRIVTINYGE